MIRRWVGRPLRGRLATDALNVLRQSQASRTVLQRCTDAVLGQAALARHSFAQARHRSAHSLHAASSCFSHSTAHFSHASAQTTAIACAIGPFLADTLAQTPQMSAQSRQSLMHALNDALPELTSFRHASTQARHADAQSVHLASQLSPSDSAPNADPLVCPRTCTTHYESSTKGRVCCWNEGVARMEVAHSRANSAGVRYPKLL